MTRQTGEPESAGEGAPARGVSADGAAKPVTRCTAQLGGCTYPSCRCRLPLTGTIAVIAQKQRPLN
jgi:hypothetical protein